MYQLYRRYRIFWGNIDEFDFEVLRKKHSLQSIHIQRHKVQPNTHYYTSIPIPGCPYGCWGYPLLEREKCVLYVNLPSQTFKCQEVKSLLGTYPLLNRYTNCKQIYPGLQTKCFKHKYKEVNNPKHSNCSKNYNVY